MSASSKVGIADLTKFDRAQKFAEARRKCPVCALPVEVRDALREGTEKKIPTDTKLAWLKTRGHKITKDDLRTHSGGAHEDKLRALEDGSDG